MSDDNVNPTDASLSECGHQRFERNHYFHGKLMTARDMAAEQAYHVRQRRAHARSVGGSGVVWGLDTTIEDDGDGDLLVTVLKGYAVDDCGRPVLVPEKYTKTVTDETVVGSSAVGVWIHFESCLKESVPVDGAESACEDECAYNRVLEVYDVEVRDATASPSDPAPDDPESVAKIVPTVEFPDRDDYATTGREQPGVGDPELSTIAASFRDEVDENWSEPSDSRLYLGSFSSPPETSDETEWDRDPTQPEPYVYTNDMLYAGLARHTADFENPHQVGLTTADVSGENAGVVHTLDDQSAASDVTISGQDGSVDVVHAGDRTIDLSVEDHVDEVVEDRIEPLERYAVERALKRTGIVFRAVPGRFSGEAGTLGAEIATKARKVSDGRLDADSDADAAEKLTIRDEDGSVERVIEGDVYEILLGEFLDLEESFHGAVDDQVTKPSAKRLDEALGRLDDALSMADPGHRRLGAAQDDVVDAIEWLEPADTASASLAKNVVKTARGDIAELTVSLSNTDTATLVIGGEDVNYESTVELTDDSGDGEVTVLMNTYTTGRTEGEEDVAFGTLDEGDSVSAELGTEELDTVLSPADYDISVQVDGHETDVGTLLLQPRTTGSLAIQRAPGPMYTGGLDSLQAVYDAQDDGHVTDTDAIVRGETLVLEVAANGIFGALSEYSGEKLTEFDPIPAVETSSLFELLVASDDGEVALKLEETAQEDRARAFADPVAGRLFVLFDTDDASFDGGSFEPGRVFEATFTVTEDGPLVDDEETVGDTVEVVEAEGEFNVDAEEEVLVVEKAPNQTIGGETVLAPGTKVTVGAKGGDESPFLMTEETRIAVDGGFAGVFNFEDVSADASFEATLQSALLKIGSDAVVLSSN